jgi:hypothetical protein
LLLFSARVFQAGAADDTLFRVYSRAVPRSVVSRSFAGAGSAVPHDVFQGLVNPALATVGFGASGACGVGYGRDGLFDKIALPLGVLFFEKDGGALGAFYSYLDGGRGAVHDAVVNFAGRLFDRMDAEGTGPVEFGLNVRYENSVWRHDVPAPVAGGDDGNASESGASTVTARGNSLLIDIGFYQQYLPGFDFSLVFSNLAGYRWSEADGRGKSEGWLDGRHRLITAGMLCSFPVTGSFLLRFPVDVEMADVFVKSSPVAFMLRAGAELRIVKMYSLRFGYARAPKDPAELVTAFDYGNLFFGGIGVEAKGVQLDVFAGKNEFGASATYRY